MPEALGLAAFRTLAEGGAPVVDLRPLASYRHCHLPGAISVPYSGSAFLAQAQDVLPVGASCLLLDDVPLLTAAADQVLTGAGIIVLGWLAGGTRTWMAAGLATAALAEWTPGQLAKERRAVRLIDVREPWEVASGVIAGSNLIPLGELPAAVRALPADDTYVMVCRTGARSSYAQSYLGRHGRRAINLQGGIVAWQEVGEAVVPPGGSRE